MQQSAEDQGLKVDEERASIEEPTGNDDDDIWSVEDSEVTSIVKLEERRSGRQPKPSQLGLDYIAGKSEGNSSRNRIASQISKPATSPRKEVNTSLALEIGCIVRINIGIHANHNAVIGNRRADGRYGLDVLDSKNNSIGRKSQMGIEHLTLLSRPGITTSGISDYNKDVSVAAKTGIATSGDNMSDRKETIAGAGNIESVMGDEDPSRGGEDDPSTGGGGLSTKDVQSINTEVGIDTIAIDFSDKRGDQFSNPSTSTTEGSDEGSDPPLALEKGCIVLINLGIYRNHNGIIGNRHADGRYGLEILDSDNNTIARGQMKMEKFTVLSQSSLNYWKGNTALPESTEGRTAVSGDDASRGGGGSLGGSLAASRDRSHINNKQVSHIIDVSNISSRSSRSSNVTIDSSNTNINNRNSNSHSDTVSSEESEELSYQVKNFDKGVYIRIPEGKFAGRIARLSNRKKGTSAFLVTVLKKDRETANTSTSIAKSNYELIRNNPLIISGSERKSIEKDEEGFLRRASLGSLGSSSTSPSLKPLSTTALLPLTASLFSPSSFLRTRSGVHMC
jgi:hypothetical protein